MNRHVLILLIVSLIIAGVVSWFASPEPDGLERVAIDSGFDDLASDHPLHVMSDYEIPGVHRFFATPLAGVLGTLVVFGLVLLIGRIASLRRRSRE